MTKEEIKQYNREYYQKNKERIKEQTREYSKNNKDKVKERKRAYYEANKHDINIKSKRYYQEHSEEIKQRAAEYYENNRAKVLQYASESQMARANNLLSAYNQQDEIHGRGRGDLTAKWIVTNIFSQPCPHCGEADWRKIGCNRLDNTKPHTMDNVEPCCRKCNIQMGADDRKKAVLQCKD